MSKENPDLIQYIVNHWKEYNPNLDVSGTEIIGRIVRINSLTSLVIDKNMGRFDLAVGEFDVLAALLREPSKQLTSKQIQELVLISSGGLTNRIDRLEKRHLIVRQPNPNDRRSSLITLTTDGETLVNQILSSHLDIERSFIQCLTESEQQQLKTLLQKLLVDVDTQNYNSVYPQNPTK